MKTTERFLRAGGVGYYPARGFVHLDAGEPRYWTKARRQSRAGRRGK